MHGKTWKRVMGADPLWGESDALFGISKSLVKVTEAGVANRSVGVEQVVVRLQLHSLLTGSVSGSKVQSFRFVPQDSASSFRVPTLAQAFGLSPSVCV